MNASVQQITLAKLALAFVPPLVVFAIFVAWSLEWRSFLHAMARMLLQLLGIGYVLALVFQSRNVLVVLAVLTVMVLTATWIALRTTPALRRKLYWRTLGAVLLGGGATLIVVTQAVLTFEPRYAPRFVIPLAGMIFANAMNSVSLAADRVTAELARAPDYRQARRVAFRASLIPAVNSLFAVGLVALPGMMTGQILSGVSPLIAARYQIMVMCMVTGAAGMSSALFLSRARSVLEAEPGLTEGPNDPI
jgi:putative ABC transport system permease protein